MTTATAEAAQVALSTEQIAARAQLWPRLVEQLMQDEERRGHVEQVAGSWRLTAAAELAHGQHLRGMEL